MNKTIARLKYEAAAQGMNVGLDDDAKMAFTVPTLDDFYCTVEDAEAFYPDGLDKEYEVVSIPQTVVDSTFPLPKRRKLPV